MRDEPYLYSNSRKKKISEKKIVFKSHEKIGTDRKCGKVLPKTEAAA
eukprot:COSAG06_NODE_51079_length_314_cov_1.013953_1_plen_46_part_10